MTGDLALGLPRPLDGPGTGGAAAPLDAPEAGDGGCDWGVLTIWLWAQCGRSLWSWRSLLEVSRMAVLLMMICLVSVLSALPNYSSLSLGFFWKLSVLGAHKETACKL